MKTIGVLGLVLCVSILVCGNSYAQDSADASKAKIAELRKDLKPLKAELGDVQKKLQLNKDEDLLKLKEDISKAQQAYKAAVKEKILADSDGKRILETIERIESDIKGLSKKAPKAKKEKQPREKKPKKKKTSDE